MQTKNIVQASANVIRITNLQTGDLYKRFDDSQYSRDVKFGFVRNVYNDGEKTYIEAVEYKKSYRDIEANIYIIRGDNDVSIFPATIGEVENEFKDALVNIQKAITDKREEIKKLEQALETTQQLVSGELQAKLSTPTFKEMTQAEFNEKIRIQEAKKIEASNTDF